MENDNIIGVAGISHGKDSNAMLYVINEVLRLPLHYIVTSDVWFDENLRAELPPMVEWKAKADKIILDRWGIPVTHICAMRGGAVATYKGWFYHRTEKGKYIGDVYGFPKQQAPWCNSKIKFDTIDTFRHLLLAEEWGGYARDTIGFPMQGKPWCNALKRNLWVSEDGGEGEQVQRRPQNRDFSVSTAERGAKTNIVQYIGIAADEPERIARHSKKPNIRMPLVEAGWTEAMCYEWCKENDLLAPTYTTAMRDGCWFCHNQGVDQLRNLYHNYPDLWARLMKLDEDSPVPFHADGHTVHDFDRRFKWEDEGYMQCGKSFRWDETKYQQMNIFQLLDKEET